MIRRFLKLRPGEERIVLLLGGFSFLMLAGMSVQSAAAESFFLSELDPAKLAFGILYGQLLTIPAFALYGLARRKLRPRWLNPTLVIVMVATLLGLYALASTNRELIAYAFISLGPCFGGILGSEGGRLSASLVDSRSARRLVPLIGTIGGIGATFGSTLVTQLSERVGLAALFVIAAALLALVTIPAWFVRESQRPRLLTVPAPPSAILRHRYVLMMVLAAVAVAVIGTILRYQMGFAAREHYSGAELGTFFGQFGTVLNASSIVFTLFVSRYLIQKLGAGTSLLMYPLFVGLTALAGAIHAGLATTIATVFSERLIRQNVHRTVSLIAMMPIHAEIRARVALTLNGTIRPVAIGVTALYFLVGDRLAPALQVDWKDLFWAILALSGLIFAALIYVRRRYVFELINALHARRLKLDDAPAAALTIDAPLKTLLLGHLGSDLPERCSLALQLFRGFVDDEVVETIAARWPDWEPWLRAEAVRLLRDEPGSGTRAFIESLSGDEPDAVGAVRISVLGGEMDEAGLRNTIDTAQPETRAHAAVELARRHGPGEIAALIERWSTSDSKDDKLAAAAVLANLQSDDLDNAIPALIRAAPEAILGVIAKRPQAAHAALCIPWLGYDQSFVAARTALQSIGAGAIATLEAAASDTHAGSGAVEILASIDDDEARAAIRRLLDHSDGDIRLRAARSRSHLDRALDADELRIVNARLEEALSRVERFDDHARSAAGLLQDVALSERQFCLETVFVCLKLKTPQTPYRQLYLASQSFDSRQRALAAEALEASLPAAVSRRLLPVLEAGDRPAVVNAATDDDWQAIRSRIEPAAGGETAASPLAMLKASGLFPGWRIGELEMLLAGDHGSDPARVVIRGGEAVDLETVLMTGKSPEAHAGDVVVSLKALYATIAANPRCGGLWLQGLAMRVPASDTAGAEVTRSEMLSLATRTLARDQDAANDISLWQRVFFLRTMALTQALPSHRLRLLAEISRTVTAAPGEVIVNEGRLGHHFYMVCTGSLEVLSRGVAVARLGPSDGLGAMALMRGERQLTTVRAAESSELLTIDRVDFLDLIDAHPSLVRSFSRMLASQIVSSRLPADSEA